MKKNRIIVLVNDTGENPRLANEHGFSALLEYKDNKILFDTGQSDKFIHNAEKLGVDLRDVDHVIISHGHYDHIGGLKYFLELNRTAKVHIKREALKKKYKFNNGEFVNIGTNDDYSPYKGRFVFSSASREIVNNVFIITNINDFGSRIHNKNMFVEKNEKIEVDPFNDEQFLFVRDNEKIHIISGCSHRGIFNIAKTALNYSKLDRIGVLVGGFHMVNEYYSQIKKEVGALSNLNIEEICPCHCTGEMGKEEIKNKFLKHYLDVGTGDIIYLG